jgi:hypothetical protein
MNGHGHCKSSDRAQSSGEDKTMTSLEIYLLAAPVVVTGLGWLYAQWLIRH